MTALPLVAFLGGLLPGCIWLFFWLLEDRCEPEPKRYIILAFMGGMLAVLVALPIEQYFQGALSGFLVYAAWAATEEIVKFGMAYFLVLRSGVFDEPLDAVIYMVTIALGFSVVENALFLASSIRDNNLYQALAIGDLRFVGATLLHTLTSATIGVCIALAFNKRASVRRLAALGGVILATLLHTLFNFFILKESSYSMFVVFAFVWIGIVALLLVVERIKIPERDYC